MLKCIFSSFNSIVFAVATAQGSQRTQQRLHRTVERRELIESTSRIGLKRRALGKRWSQRREGRQYRRMQWERARS